MFDYIQVDNENEKNQKNYSYPCAGPSGLI